jgi:hypothetical protein
MATHTHDSFGDLAVTTPHRPVGAVASLTGISAIYASACCEAKETMPYPRSILLDVRI